MRRTLTLVTSFLFSIMVACGEGGLEFRFPDSGGSGGEAGTELTILIPENAASLGNTAFGPNPRVVEEGTTITWINNDTVAHTITSDNGAFDSSTLDPNEQFAFTFNNVGLFPYKSTTQPNAIGSIQVVTEGSDIVPVPTSTDEPLPPPAPPFPSPGPSPGFPIGT